MTTIIVSGRGIRVGGPLHTRRSSEDVAGRADMRSAERRPENLAPEIFLIGRRVYICSAPTEARNARLRKAVVDLTLDKLVLAEAANGNFRAPRVAAPASTMSGRR